MKEFFDILLDALIDSAKILPILLAVYFLIEFLEYKFADKYQKSQLLKGKVSPIFGALFGCIPQCGFSVIASDLYSKRRVSVGALIAVFIATSDEAIPIMLSNYKSIPALFALIGIKLVFGILIGYLGYLLYPLIFKKSIAKEQAIAVEKEEHSLGCCNHDVGAVKKYDYMHPLIHSLKIFLIIFVANILIGVIVEFGFKGEENLARFLTSSYALQPLFACLIGLIPNCASSVVLTQLYLMGGISFGSIVAGLSVNAGIGMLILFKQNKKVLENLFIIGLIIVSSLALGYGLHFLI